MQVPTNKPGALIIPPQSDIRVRARADPIAQPFVVKPRKKKKHLDAFKNHTSSTILLPPLR